MSETIFSFLYFDSASESFNNDSRAVHEFSLIFAVGSRYYKKFTIPDMDRLKLPLQQSAINIAHANNTLLITVS